MAASRNQAAFSGVGARSSDWFWSWKTRRKKTYSVSVALCKHDKEAGASGQRTVSQSGGMEPLHLSLRDLVYLKMCLNADNVVYYAVTMRIQHAGD